MAIAEEIKKFSRELTLKSILGLVVLILIVVLTLRFVETEFITDLIETLGIFGPLILIFAKALALVVAPINGAPFYILAAALYGPILGGLYAFIGDMIGAIVSFFIARKFGQGIVNKLFGDKEEALIPKILESMSSVRGLVAIHIFLVMLPDIINYVAGLSSVKFKTFFFVHLPFAFAFAFGTSYLTSIFMQIESIGKGTLIVLSLVAMFIGIFVFQRYGKYLQKKENSIN